MESRFVHTERATHATQGAWRLELGKELGRGNGGTVHAAVRHGQRIAVKIAPLEATERQRRRLKHEAKVCAHLAHHRVRGVVPFLGHGHHEGRPYLAFARARGNLRQHLAKGVALAEARRIAGALARNVASVHRVGVCHLDIKPANVLLTPNGNIALGDFGAAVVLNTSAEGDLQNVLYGTPAYISPERWQGAAASPAMDIYALGVVMHELFTGRRPFETAAPAGRMHLPEGLAGLVAMCLCGDPDQRPCAAGVARALMKAEPDESAPRMISTPVEGAPSTRPLAGSTSPELVITPGEKDFKGIARQLRSLDHSVVGRASLLGGPTQTLDCSGDSRGSLSTTDLAVCFGASPSVLSTVLGPICQRLGQPLRVRFVQDCPPHPETAHPVAAALRWAQEQGRLDTDVGCHALGDSS